MSTLVCEHPSSEVDHIVKSDRSEILRGLRASSTAATQEHHSTFRVELAETSFQFAKRDIDRSGETALGNLARFANIDELTGRADGGLKVGDGVIRIGHG